MGNDLSLLTRQTVKAAGKRKLEEPQDYNVILLNDDYTSMDFVVNILMLVFHKSEEDACRIMLDVHIKDRGLVGLYPQDVALTKVEQVHSLAGKHGYPLKCIVEKA
jgi:ATP-dependent Clp protease adaptor protein ClpS